MLYFVAILLEEPYREVVHLLKLDFKERYNSKASLNSPPHITLHMPFQWREKGEGELIEKLSLFCSRQSAFTITFSNFGCFEPRVIFIDIEKSEQLDRLQRNLSSYCKQNLNLFNANYKELPFNPHITIAFRDLKKPAFYEAWREFKDKPFEGSFKASSITLLKHNGRLWEKFKDFYLR